MSLPGESQRRGAWWAATSGVAQSWAWLKRLSSSSSRHGAHSSEQNREVSGLHCGVCMKETINKHNRMPDRNATVKKRKAVEEERVMMGACYSRQVVREGELTATGAGPTFRGILEWCSSAQSYWKRMWPCLWPKGVSLRHGHAWQTVLSQWPAGAEGQTACLPRVGRLWSGRASPRAPAGWAPVVSGTPLIKVLRIVSSSLLSCSFLASHFTLQEH